MPGLKGVASFFAAMALFVCWAALAEAGGQKKETPKMSRLTIQVTGGDESKPVAEASVYLKSDDTGKRGKGGKFELNLKTNQEGVTHSPEIFQGKVLIQVVAPGWKTFGQYFDAQEAEQTIQIHLQRPNTKWY